MAIHTCITTGHILVISICDCSLKTSYRQHLLLCLVGDSRFGKEDVAALELSRRYISTILPFSVISLFVLFVICELKWKSLSSFEISKIAMHAVRLPVHL